VRFTGERVLLLLVAVGVCVALLPARTASRAAEAEERKVRVGLVFDVGGRGDKSFNDAAYLGLVRAEKELGVEAAFLEPAATEDREAGLRLFAAQGMDLVIGVGFIFSSDVDAVAADYPGVRFACVDYAPGPRGIVGMPTNVLALVFREEEGSFLVGAAAGQLSKSKVVGFVGGAISPLIKKFEAGYAAGVRAVCPDCSLRVGYIGSTPDAFKDPAKGKAIAISQASAGADIIYHAAGASGRGVFEGAKESGALAVGVDTDQHDEMPGTVVTSMVKRMDVTVFEAIQSVMNDRFEAGMHVFGLRERGLDWVHEGPHATGVPERVRDQVEALRADIVAGTLQVPTQ